MGGQRWWVQCLDKAVCPDLQNPSRELYKGGFLQSFREQIRGFHDFLRLKSSSMFILLEWSCLPDNIFHISAFDAVDAGVTELDAVSRIDAVLHHS
jgi:hypothetical protein